MNKQSGFSLLEVMVVLVIIGMIMSNVRDEPFKTHLEAYLKENGGECEVTIDMFLEECVTLINFALYKKGAALETALEES